MWRSDTKHHTQRSYIASSAFQQQDAADMQESRQKPRFVRTSRGDLDRSIAMATDETMNEMASDGGELVPDDGKFVVLYDNETASSDLGHR